MPDSDRSIEIAEMKSLRAVACYVGTEINTYRKN